MRKSGLQRRATPRRLARGQTAWRAPAPWGAPHLHRRGACAQLGARWLPARHTHESTRQRSAAACRTPACLWSHRSAAPDPVLCGCQTRAPTATPACTRTRTAGKAPPDVAARPYGTGALRRSARTPDDPPPPSAGPDRRTAARTRTCSVAGYTPSRRPRCSRRARVRSGSCAAVPGKCFVEETVVPNAAADFRLKS